MWPFARKESQQTISPQNQIPEQKPQEQEIKTQANEPKKPSLFSGMSVRKNKLLFVQQIDKKAEEVNKPIDNKFKKEQVEKTLEELKFDVFDSKVQPSREKPYTLPITLDQIRKQDKYTPPEINKKQEDIQKHIFQIKEEIEQEKLKQKEIQIKIDKQIQEEERLKFLSDIGPKLLDSSDYKLKEQDSTEVPNSSDIQLQQQKINVQTIQKITDNLKAGEQENKQVKTSLENNSSNQESTQTHHIEINQQQPSESSTQDPIQLSDEEKQDSLIEIKQKLTTCLQGYKECFTN